jgi:hypothetical protein
MATSYADRRIRPDVGTGRILFFITLSQFAVGVLVAAFIHPLGWLVAALFGAMSLVQTNGWFFNSTEIQVDSQGFTAWSLRGGRVSGRWSEVESFQLTPGLLTGIVFSYRSAATRRRSWWPFCGQWDGYIGFPIGQDLEEVAKLLNDYRAHYGGR